MKTRRFVRLLILVLLVAAFSSAATRIHMIKTAHPSEPCTITWSDGSVHEYE